MTFAKWAALMTLALGLVGAHLYWLYSLLPDLCATDVRRTIPSPDRSRSIVMFGKDCGATTPFNTQLAIVRGERQPTSVSEDPFLVLRDKHDLKIYWLDPSSLSVTLPGARIYRKQEQEGDVKIVYR